MSGALLLLLATTTLDAAERVPLHLIVDTRGAKQVTTSQVIARLDEVLARRTDFAVAQLPGQLAAGCAGDAICMGIAVAKETPRDTKIALILSVRPGLEAGDRLAALLLDPQAALACENDPQPERCLGTVALAEMVQDGIADGATLDRALQRLIETEAQPVLADRGHWEPYGQLEVVSDLENTEILLNERTLGRIGLEPTTVVGLRPGLKRLTFQRSDQAPETREVRVAAGETTKLSVVLRRGVHPVRPVLLWTGVGLAAIGAALTVWALAAAPKAQFCTGDACGGTLVSVGTLVRGDEDRLRRDVLAGPLGYSLVATGAGLSLSSLFWGEAPDAPWWGIAVSVGAGLVLYGVSHLLDDAL